MKEPPASLAFAVLLTLVASPSTSYLDLLTCIQMADEMKSGSKKPR